MIKPTAATAFHAAGMATTALAAHTAVNYLQNYSPDYQTALGFSAAISSAVFFGWAFTLSSKTKTRLLPMLAASVLMTIVSGYTVYQSSIMPLEAAAITAAAEKDQPRIAAFQQQTSTYNASHQNLQTSIDDLRRQNLADEQTLPTITGKGADRKKQQLRNKVADRNKIIGELTTKQSQLSAPAAFTATQPEPLKREQTLPMLARAFAFELIAVMFMLFARFAKSDEDQQQTGQATQLAPMLTTAEKHIRTLQNLFAQSEKCTNTPFVRANECANASANEPAETMTTESAITLLKNRMIETTDTGNITLDTIMQTTGLGRRKAEQILEESATNGALTKIKAGRGYTYRYPETAKTNVIQLRSTS